MDKATCWLLTDSLGEGVSNWRWGRGVTHTLWPAAICGYCTESAHLPYLLDPLYERYGPGAKLWLSEIGQPRHEDSVRVSSNTWTRISQRSVLSPAPTAPSASSTFRQSRQAGGGASCGREKKFPS